MTLVDTTAGEVVAPCDAAEARTLTERIKSCAEELWALLAEAHDRRAWAALGYESFKAYVTTEFGMSKQRAFQLLDQAKVIEALNAAVESTTVDPITVSEREARDLKPRLDNVVERVRAETAGVPPERVPEIVSKIVEEGIE